MLGKFFAIVQCDRQHTLSNRQHALINGDLPAKLRALI